MVVFGRFLCCLFSALIPAYGLQSSLYLEVEDLLVEGKELADDQQFSASLRILNLALGKLKQTPRNHPLRLEAEKLMRITKGRSLVERYRGGKLDASSSPDALRPLAAETREFKIKQAFGKALARKVYEPRDNLRTGEILGLGRRVTTLPNGGIELVTSSNNAFTIRTVQASSFDLLDRNHFALHSGAYVFHSILNDSDLSLKSPIIDLQVSSEQPFAIMVGVTTNGGLKIISLLGEISLRNHQEKIGLVPGELTFALSDGFSRKMNVELSTLIVTSNLLTDFDEPPIFLKKLRQQAMMQALRTRQRFRTVVGDVKGNDNFELKVLEEKPR